mmetsp:Transcript_14789/g.33972  ORF Transcript_14789/g.33972 Transcript_14789/m.33972 type:complete len:169 (-) Transcript_14789:96-602(-)|eukprot:751209-Hanusia_phi.AAC.1
MADSSLPSTPTEQYDLCPKTSVEMKPPRASRQTRIARPKISGATRKTYSGLRDRDLHNWAGQLLRRKLDDLIDVRDGQNNANMCDVRDRADSAGDGGGKGLQRPERPQTQESVQNRGGSEAGSGVLSGISEKSTEKSGRGKKRKGTDNQVDTNKLRRSDRLQKQSNQG